MHTTQMWRFQDESRARGSEASPSRRREAEEQTAVVIMWAETRLVISDLISSAVVNLTAAVRRAQPHGRADLLNCDGVCHCRYVSKFTPQVLFLVIGS